MEGPIEWGGVWKRLELVKLYLLELCVLSCSDYTAHSIRRKKEASAYDFESC